MTIEIDPATGLPELSGNQFWRVTDFMPGYIEDAGYRVLLMERIVSVHTETRWRWGRGGHDLITEREDITCVDGRTVLGALTSESILKAATNIIESRIALEATKELIGDYPPNKLEK